MLQSFFTLNCSLTIKKNKNRIFSANRQFDCEAKCTCERTSSPGWLSLFQERANQGKERRIPFQKESKTEAEWRLNSYFRVYWYSWTQFVYLCHFLNVLERSKVRFSVKRSTWLGNFVGFYSPKAPSFKNKESFGFVLGGFLGFFFAHLFCFVFKWIHFNHGADPASFRKTRFQKDLLELPWTPPGNTETTAQGYQI